jgi:hypothetical protein
MLARKDGGRQPLLIDDGISDRFFDREPSFAIFPRSGFDFVAPESRRRRPNQRLTSGDSRSIFFEDPRQ